MPNRTLARRPSPPVTLPRMPLPDAPQHIAFSYDPEVAEAARDAGSGHLHWTITAFHKLDERGIMLDSVSITVEAASEQEAIARAQAIVVREKYRVSAVNETCTLDPALNKE